MPRSKKTTPEENSKKKPQLKKSTKKKTSPIKKSAPTEKTTENVELKFHEVFPIKLEHLDKSINEKKVCYFQCKEHLESYLKRYKLKKGKYAISETEKR